MQCESCLHTFEVVIILQVLYVAHAGDSRAVLASDGEALRLTSDHKPDRPDECARVWVRAPAHDPLLCR